MATEITIYVDGDTNPPRHRMGGPDRDIPILNVGDGVQIILYDFQSTHEQRLDYLRTLAAEAAALADAIERQVQP